MRMIANGRSVRDAFWIGASGGRSASRRAAVYQKPGPQGRNSGDFRQAFFMNSISAARRLSSGKTWPWYLLPAFLS